MEAIDVDGHLVRRLHDYRCPCIQGSPPRRRCAPVPRHRRYRPGPLQTHWRAVLGPPLGPHPWTPAVGDVVACCFDENRWLHATDRAGPENYWAQCQTKNRALIDNKHREAKETNETTSDGGCLLVIRFVVRSLILLPVVGLCSLLGWACT
jgi:hypothetical protein